MNNHHSLATEYWHKCDSTLDTRTQNQRQFGRHKTQTTHEIYKNGKCSNFHLWSLIYSTSTFMSNLVSVFKNILKSYQLQIECISTQQKIHQTFLNNVVITCRKSNQNFCAINKDLRMFSTTSGMRDGSRTRLQSSCQRPQHRRTSFWAGRSR